MPRRRLLLHVALGCLATWLFVGVGMAAPSKIATAGIGDDYEERLKPGVCWCHKGQGTWAYLRSPLKPPKEPPRCGLLLHGGDCGKRPRPKGQRAMCWSGNKKSCFWKRHCISYDIQCSVCWTDEECEACDEAIGGPDKKKGDWLAKRLAREAEVLGKKNLVIVRSPHFYVITNLHRKVKLDTRKGGRRLMTAHEVAHLYAQRCEQAYNDFVHWFGGPIGFTKPTAVFVVDTEVEFRKVGERYFGRGGIHMNYAFGHHDRISDGVSGNGFVVAAQRENSDQNMHAYCRHQIGHILFSCWTLNNGFEDHCPRWAWCGAAHFLEKLIDPLHEGYATFCYGEASKGGTGPMAKWPKRVKKLAGRGPEPIETFFGRNSLSALRYEDHLRAWSFMDLGLREDRTRWLKMLKRLRNAQDEAIAFKEELGVTPEVFHQRWTERLLGERDTIGPEKKPDEDITDPLVRELMKVEESENADLLAGRIRGLDVIEDVRAARLLLRFMDHESDLVRETIHLVLTKTKNAEVLKYLSEEGLGDPRWVVRAGVTRALGQLKHEPARYTIETLLTDRSWLVRANAAYALQQIGNRISRRQLLRRLSEKDPKAWISACDAYAAFPGRSKDATLQIMPYVEHKLWQVRLTACRALRRVGTADCLDLLIKRFREETGRLRRELYAALVGVSGHDEGMNPVAWEKWWRDQQEKHGGLPPKPVKEPT
ncbi:MAG: HEAT repeat domain-containing protein, partial [Planctomycetota bacterium]|nr:HEAT repeat domain-containing protein [Planctomycetota bacterium]